MKNRQTRIQGLIIQDHNILLIRAYEIQTGVSFWVIPGGGLEPGESEEECLIREMKEETGLEVEVESLIFDIEAPDVDQYRRLKSYLCTPVGGQLEPGSEPEAADQCEIAAVRWFDLKDISRWSSDLRLDPYTYPHLQKVRQLLGYTTEK